MGLQGKVGTRLNVNINYDTQSTFAFQNLIKLEYDPGVGGIDPGNLKNNIPKNVNGIHYDNEITNIYQFVSAEGKIYVKVTSVYEGNNTIDFFIIEKFNKKTTSSYL